MGRLAIFDFDGTLFPLETIPFLMKQYKNSKYSNIRLIKVYLKVIPLFLSYKLFGKMTKESFRRKAVHYFMSMFDQMEASEVEGFFYQQGLKMIDLLDDMVVEEFIKSKEAGYTTLLLSGCFEGVVNTVGASLGFDHVIGTCVSYESDHTYNKNTELDIISGQRKIEIIKENFYDIDYLQSKAYADSVYDRVILEAVGQPIAVNPDKGLEFLAKSIGWQVLKTR